MLRNDKPEITVWLMSHFYRWLIGSFDVATPVLSANQYLLLSGEPTPEWLIQRFDSATTPTPCFYIHPQQPLLLERERRLVEFLNSRQGTPIEGKLQRINCIHAFSLWEKEHAQIQDRQRRGWIPSSGLALKEVLCTPNGTWFMFDSLSPHLREEIAYESYHMQHCLGQFGDKKRLTGGYGESYTQRIQAGELRLFTLRSSGNAPHVTLSLQIDNNFLSIDQVKGKQNRPPISRYTMDTLALLRHLNITPETHYDCEAMGLIAQQESSEWQLLTELTDLQQQNNILTRQPQLFAMFTQLSPQQQWLALASAPLHKITNLGLDATLRLASSQLYQQSNDPAWLSEILNGQGQQWQIEGIPLSGSDYAKDASC
ncbi:hypothetical protein ACFQNF_16110 [Iodobacter arcticus]|uniref:Uncharacterized protein n=1 Tax=Iodobacter arcticus TaxID=590593 RepID=A0ABW2R0T8_9NEIS